MSMLTAGDPFPFFDGRTPLHASFRPDTMGGRYLVFSFFVSAGAKFGQRFLAAMAGIRDRFDDSNRAWFGVSIDPQDEAAGRLKHAVPGIRFFYDFDRRISTLFGIVGAAAEGAITYQPTTFVIGPNLQIVARLPMAAPEESAALLAAVLDALPPLHEPFAAPPHAPVLTIPDVLEPDLCRRLIDAYDAHGGLESGYMQERDGLTVGVMGRHRKRRRDSYVTDAALKAELRDRLRRRVCPAIHRSFLATVGHVERYLVACYDGAEEGCFLAHRDNESKGTAHRQFAVSINLNGDFGGGHLSFPEFGRALYKAPPGAAVVFACSLLHEARPVTSGRRLVFLTFLYDGAMARLRAENARFLADPAAALRPAAAE